MMEGSFEGAATGPIVLDAITEQSFEIRLHHLMKIKGKFCRFEGRQAGMRMKNELDRVETRCLLVF